jgi:hypothetical protein
VRDASDENLAHIVSLWSSKELADEYRHSDLRRWRWQRMQVYVVGETETAAGDVRLWPRIQPGPLDWVSRW